MLNAEIRDAVRFYIGDIRKRLGDGSISSEVEQGHPLYRDAEIYRTINALMFPGIHNEKERIITEGHILNPNAIIELKTLLNIFSRLALAARMRCDNSTIFSRRIDRVSTVSLLMHGEIPSFFSTGKGEFQQNYSKKAGLVLLEFQINPNIPVIDVETILGDEYLKKEEREILIPPFLAIDIFEIPLNCHEKCITDLNGDPPKCKFNVVFSSSKKKPDDNNDYNAIYSWLTDNNRLTQIAEIVACLNKNYTLSSTDKENYCFWKQQLRKYLKNVIFKND